MTRSRGLWLTHVMEITKNLTYGGKIVATVATVTPIGINFEVAFTNGYRIVVPPSQLSDEVRALVA